MLENWKVVFPIPEAQTGFLYVWRQPWFLVSGTLEPLATFGLQKLPGNTGLRSPYSRAEEPI